MLAAVHEAGISRATGTNNWQSIAPERLAPLKMLTFVFCTVGSLVDAAGEAAVAVADVLHQPEL